MTETDLMFLSHFFKIEENSRNVHTLRSYYDQNLSKSILWLADLHWDHPKCVREFLKKHLDQAKEKNAGIVIVGDLFCIMQGKVDKRGTKKDVRPEHNTGTYFDSVIDTAVEYFGPYAEHILLVTEGNHETSIEKYHETNILKRFVDKMNLVHRPAQPIRLGGYGGWLRLQFDRKGSKDTRTLKVKYFHGSGGGGIVTHGMISNQRRQGFVHGADLIISGHVHEDLNTTFVSESLNPAGNIVHNETVHHIISTYKDEYGDGKGGWHIERGMPPKVLGGSWMDIFVDSCNVKFNIYRAK